MLEVSDLFTSIQGEGPLAGTPSVFLRTRRCNLRCSWCDTKYTWDRADPGYAFFDVTSVKTLVAHIENWAALGISQKMKQQYTKHYPKPKSWDIAHLVITGGEPLIWRRELMMLLDTLINSGWIFTVEVETNGTISPHWPRQLEGALGVRYNVSPKLRGAGNKGLTVWQPEVLRDFAGRDSYFKFVITNMEAEQDDLRSYLSFLRNLGVGDHRLYLMPQGGTTEELGNNLREIQSYAARLGVQMTDRQHVWIWGAERGV